MNEIKIKKLHPDAQLPEKAYPSDAGADLKAVSMKTDGDVITYGTGIAMEIPEGHVGLIFPRSSVYKKALSMTNCVGVIDSHYRGEVLVKFRKTNTFAERYNIGDRIAQIIIMPYPDTYFVEVSELTKTDRGEGGHGSTGK